MATTSLWHIKGSLSDLIAYVENPEKTASKGTEDFFNVFSYIQNPQKTADGSFITAINCLKQTALRQMILTKQRYGKEDKYIAWHGYQSFKPGEVTPERCHEISNHRHHPPGQRPSAQSLLFQFSIFQRRQKVQLL